MMGSNWNLSTHFQTCVSVHIAHEKYKCEKTITNNFHDAAKISSNCNHQDIINHIPRALIFIIGQSVMKPAQEQHRKDRSMP